MRQESINRCLTITETDILKKTNNQKDQSIAENTNSSLDSDEKLLPENFLHKRRATEHQILREEIENVNEKKFHASSASLLQATFISTTAILCNSQKNAKVGIINVKFGV